MEATFHSGPGYMPVEQRLISFDDMDTKGNVILKPLRSRKSTDGKELNSNILSFRGFKDPKTDVWCGIPIGRNADGTFKFKRIIIEGHRHYNLEIKQDAQEWHVVKRHFSICLDGNFNRRHMFEVIDTEKDAQVKVDKVNQAMEAIAIINDPKMNETRLRDVARLFAIDTLNNSFIVIKQLLFEKAMNKPDYFMSVMSNDEERDIKIIVNRGMATGLIQLTMDKGYLFKNSIPLGSTEGAMITAMRKDRQMLVHIDLESKQADRFYVDEEKEKVKSEKTAKAPTPKQPVDSFEAK